MQSYQCGIQSQYIIPQNYSSITQQSKRQNILYDNYLQILQKIFKTFSNFYDQTHQLYKIKIHQKSIYLQQFKNFLRKFSEIIRDTSIYQIDCITDLRGNSRDIVTQVSNQIIQKVQQYAKPQKIFKSKIQLLSTTKQQIDKHYFQLKNQSSQPSLYYNSRNMKSKTKIISQQLTNINQIQKYLQQSKKQIQHNSDQFQNYLINFRKKLLQNKYYVLNNMIQQSKHFRNCLTQMLLLLCQCVNTKMQHFFNLLKYPKDDTISLSQNRGRTKNQDIDSIISNLIQSIQQYNYLIDQIIIILKGLDIAFKKINTQIQDILENNKIYFIDYMNNIYSIDQTPAKEVSETLDVFQYYSNKISTISDKLYQCCNKLNMLKQNVKKHADVTLSLIRILPKNKQQNKTPQVLQVYNQISYDFVTQILSNVYKSFKQTLMDLKTYFNQKYYKRMKNKTQNSMEVSHIDQTIIQPSQKKKPSKKQLWLWKDWRDKTNYYLHSSINHQKQIVKFISSIKNQQQSKQIDKFQCIYLGKKDIKGVLKICQKSLQFISLTGTSNLQLIVPYFEIRSLSIKVRIFQKYISIQTQKGQLGFSKFINYQQVQKQINDQIQKLTKQSNKNIIKYNTIQLLSQQIDFIQKNKNHLQSNRPKLNNMKNIKNIFVDNINIDLVYDIIYSDQPFKIYNKPEDNFFAYAMKKTKNINYTATSYDKPGPQFYSHNNTSKFTNCPIFSTRLIQFDHPMPKIPFMPQYCHCKQTCNIYWINHQSFDYFVQSLSFGTTYTGCFQVNIVHRVYKQKNGVKIQMYGGLFFLKDFRMKSVVKSAGQKQMIQGGIFTMGQIQKALNIVSGNKKIQQHQKQQKSNQQPTNKTKTNNHQLSRLKNQNKILIATLIVVFLINIIVRFIMSQ